MHENVVERLLSKWQFKKICLLNSYSILEKWKVKSSSIITNNSKVSDIFSIKVIGLSKFIDQSDTFMMYIFITFLFWHKIPNNRHLFKFDLSESCKSLDNSQLYRFCYISILHNLFYHIDGFQSEKSQNPYGAFFLGHPVEILNCTLASFTTLGALLWNLLNSLIRELLASAS